MSIRPFETLERLRHRMAEALIAQSGMRHPALTANLRKTLTLARGAGALIPPPVLEGAFPFVPAEETLGDLPGTLLDNSTVAALIGDGSGQGYSFPSDRHPYLHQIAAWKTLCAQTPQSAIVSAGTGSGKTECFLVPMLDDLYRRGTRVSGVEAIMLYPLNALIASQQERLDAWTKPARGCVRYCLYNGDLPDKQSAIEQRDSLSRAPHCVPNRKVLRDDPPPLLVTNLTMLEYMLVRPEDDAIISASKGRLKWIVLDEAHTLVGSAAAEVALLLRRVLEAFEVDPSNVRFVATSATIGEGKAVEKQLRRFLADIGGIEVEQVTMITGDRRLPDRPGRGGSTPDADALAALDPAALYKTLGSYDPIWKLVEALKDGTVASDELDLVAKTMGSDGETLAMALTRAKSKKGDVLAPLRVHSFHRAQAGLWCCTNPGCSSSMGDGWSAGQVLFEREETCPSCRMPVAEIFACNGCGEAFLMADERGDRLEPPRSIPPIDEFQFDANRDSQTEDDAESDGSQESAEPAPTIRHCFSLTGGGLLPIFVDNATGRTADSGGEERYRLQSHGSGKGPCPVCSATPANGDKLYPFRFGAPFIIGNAAPMLLAAMPPAEKLVVPALPQGQPERPASGRQLISFTDSRQGTARMAAKLQLESERAFVRSFIYQAVQQTAASGSDLVKADEVRRQIAKMKSMAGWQDMIADVVRDKESELAKLTGGVAVTMKWTALRSELADRIELREWLPEVWGRRASLFKKGGVSYAEQIAEAVLLRELMRRPRHVNSVETMGLARLIYPAIENATVAPTSFVQAGGTLTDWKSWMTAILLFSVRSALAVKAPHELLNWIVRNGFPKSLVGPGMERGRSQQSWPAATALPKQSQVVELLRLGMKMNLGSAQDRHVMNDWLGEAWQRLQPLFPKNLSGQVALDFDRLNVAAVKAAFHCPATRRIIEIAPFGLTPYARHPSDKAEAITMPVMTVDGDEYARREFIETNETVATLRAQGLWTDLHDRVAAFSPYTRSAEHSAQIAPVRLRGYEAAFKDGRINILNCSTTMEMGVDIGSVNGVLMTNVPPSIANYRQRIGRAGRRGQPLSLGFTFAKDRPLDREAFRDPAAFLRRKMAAPRVALDSRPIVQRHVNAFLLSRFLKQHSGNPLKLKAGEFFGFPNTIDGKPIAKNERPIALFCQWLGSAITAEALKDALLRLTRKSVLEGRDDLIEACSAAIVEAEAAFTREWQGLRGQVKDAGEIGATKAIEISLQRLCGEYLLGDLADRGFLPGHGFPNHVVTFELGEAQEREDSGDDRRGRRHGGPQRPLDIALRDYAPGSETVVDGRVFRVGGVTLNWQRPASEEGAREIQSLRWAARCRACGDNFTGAGGHPESCRTCGAGDLDAIDYLKPSGFLRDIHEPVHAETDRVDFIRAEPDRISAGGAPWEALSDPTVGRLRIHRRGTVFYHTRGANRLGYGLCLRCGRMEPMQPGEETCTALQGHKPLRAREGLTEPCEGNGQTFTIRHGLQLGHEIHTDVLEIQPSANPGAGAVNAIAIALREAVARYLGIEPDEMGYGIAPSRNAMFAGAKSIFLFDRATGGAGYVARATDDIRALFKSARGLLDCPRDCRHACSSCVLVADAPEGEEELDRRSAMTFMDTHLRLPDIIAAGDVFAEGAEISDRPAAEMDDYLSVKGKAGLTVWVRLEDPVVLNDWPLTPLLHRWAANGREITLVMQDGFISKLDASQLLFLRDFATRHNLQLAEGKATKFRNGALLFAHAGNAKGGMGWASRDDGLLTPGSGWGSEHLLPVARAPIPLLGDRQTVDRERLKPPAGAVVVVLGAKFDGDVQTVGGRIAAEIHRVCLDCGIAKDDALVSVSYHDRFARSPLVLKLLIDTVSSTARLFGVSGDDALDVSIETTPDKPSPYARGQLHSDLEHDAELAALAGSYGDRRNLDVKLLVGQPPHKRSLSLRHASGAAIKVDFDQGFGWFNYRGHDRNYEQGQSSTSGALVLDRLAGKLERRHGHDSQMVVWRQL